MNSTENFGLSQWQSSDRIMMKDFNDDNSKIDAALLAARQERDTLAQRVRTLEQKAAPYVKLREITTSVGAAQVDLDLSDIVFSNYQAVHLDMALRGTSGSNAYVCVNGDRNSGYFLTLSGGNFYSYHDGIAAIPLPGDVAYHFKFPRLSLLPRRDASNYISCCALGGGFFLQYGYCEAVQFSSISKLSLIASSGTIFANSRVTIWGEI